MEVNVKNFVCIIVMIGFLAAAEVRDEDVTNWHYDEMRHESLQEVILIDSTGGTTTLWTQLHESIAYSPIADGIQIVNRGFWPTGILCVHQSPGDFSFWFHDWPYMLELGSARYPGSVAGTNAYISFPVLDQGGTWGHMGAQYESGGWFSGSWADPVDVGPGDLGVHKNIGKQLPNGDILFIGCGIIGLDIENIVFRTWDSTLTSPIASGDVAADACYWGFDINDGIAYVFYSRGNWSSTLAEDTLIFYKTTSDGINWSNEQSWSLAFTPPFANTDIIWRQMALTDDGQPRLVFDALDDDDASYPWYGKIYVSHTSGVPPVELTAALGDTETIYPTIACGGGKAAAIFNVPRNNLEDSLNWWDIHYCYSTDDGINWSTPINITELSPYRVGLQQIAKRLDTLRNRFFYVYVTDNVPFRNYDPLWLVWNAFSPTMIQYIYAGYTPIVGIEEDTRRLKVDAKCGLAVYPNPFKGTATIRCSAWQGAIPSKLQIYNTAGRLVRSFRPAYETASPTLLSWDGTDDHGNHLPAGVYFVRIQSPKDTQSLPVVLLR
jgi:hypothetical protein